MNSENSKNLNWDWEPGECPFDEDAEVLYIKEEFYGKDLEYAVNKLKTAPLMLCEALWFMAAEPFRFFVRSYEAVFLSEDQFSQLEYEAPDAAGTFFDLMEFKLKSCPKQILPVMPKLLLVAEYVASNQEKFKADPSIYGIFSERLDSLRNLYERSTK